MPKKIFDIFPPTAFREKKLPPLPKKKKLIGVKGKVVLLILTILILVSFIFHFVLSEVKIEIWPKTQILNFEEKLTADLKKKGTLDLVSDRVIPAELLETEKEASQEFPSSGKTQKEEKARGTIRVFNNYSLSQTLMANTRFQPPLEKVLYFRSTKTVVVPSKSSLDIEVIADRSGEEYNIGPATFSIPGLAGLPQYYSIYGKSTLPMEGGFKGEVPQVTKEDLERAKNVLSEKLSAEARESFKDKISTDFVLLDGATKEEVFEASSPLEAGAKARSFNFQVKVKAQALVFKKNDLESFAKEFILAQIPDGKKIQEDSLKINFAPESVDLTEGKIILNLEFSTKIYSDVDISRFRETLKGKSLNEAQAILEGEDQIIKVQIRKRPFWLERVPSKESKIGIELRID